MSQILNLFLLLLFAPAAPPPEPPIATCYGRTPCKACSNCSLCKYCNSGGTCGICEGGKQPPSITPPGGVDFSTRLGVATVKTSQATVRSGPGAQYRLLFTLPRGETLEIIEDARAPWLRVRGYASANGKAVRFEGYIHNTLLAW